MPGKEYDCEFCSEVIRKDRIAKHVKDNHKVDIGKYLLEVYEQNNGNMNDFFSKYLTTNFKNAEVIRGFYSDKHTANAEEYLFGTTPFFYSGTVQDDKEVHSYKTSKVNIEEHYKFIEECINTISLADFIRCQRKADITSDTNIQFLKEKNKMRTNIKELERQVEILKRENEFLLSSEKKAVEKANECSSVLEMDIDEINVMRSNNRALQKENSRLKINAAHHQHIVEEIKSDWEERFTSMNQSKFKEIDELYTKLEVMTKDYDKVKDKIKAEAEKIVQKQKEAKRKEKEKQKKKAKEAERKAEEAKAIAKLKSKKLKSKKVVDSDSDSDSSSDSDSDSDSSDSD